MARLTFHLVCAELADIGRIYAAGFTPGGCQVPSRIRKIEGSRFQ
jgi:hypothetical protein